MKFYDSLTKDSICSEINRICKTNDTSYSLRDKAARVNAALDRYYYLAFEADRRWNFDDINNSSPPIDTQNIVSGTNRYKLSSFTEKIINLIRLEVLNSAGVGKPLIPEILDNLNVVERGNASGQIDTVTTDTLQELYINAASGTPTHYIKYGDFIYLRPKPNYSYSNALIAYFNRPASKFTFSTFTVTIASPGVFTAAAHGLAANDTVMFETDGALPTGLSVDTIYYVVAAGLTTDAFEVSTSQGGSVVNTSGSQSGTHHWLKTSKEPGIPVIHHPCLARMASSPYLIENGKSIFNAIAALIQQDELAIQNYFARRDKDIVNRIIVRQENNR